MCGRCWLRFEGLQLWSAQAVGVVWLQLLCAVEVLGHGKGEAGV